MAISSQEVIALIKIGIPDATVTITDMAGDGDHYRADIVSPSFTGKSRVQQHQMVYDALGSKMGSELHALSIKTSES
ncbi:MAG: BolA family transcriptional regulator [Alphaproteobacteria bacterium CG1_02_46_17]|nr:MAG: BolA family transcriptional regulator [Alphaproteobacteria bacterium CG1_02_46_17]